MEAIIITAIIAGGIVGLAWVALHFGYKAWLEGRNDEAEPYRLTVSDSPDEVAFKSRGI